MPIPSKRKWAGNPEKDPGDEPMDLKGSYFTDPKGYGNLPQKKGNWGIKSVKARKYTDSPFKKFYSDKN